MRTRHQVNVELGADYPLTPPRARMLTGTFNPHVYPHQGICLGGWRPTESLDALVLRIGALLQWDPRVINLNSLASAEAGHWAREHFSLLPLDTVDFKAPAASPAPAETVPPSPATTPRPSNPAQPPPATTSRPSSPPQPPPGRVIRRVVWH